MTEFSYRYNNPETADVIISFQSMVGAPREEDKGQVLKAISKLGGSSPLSMPSLWRRAQS